MFLFRLWGVVLGAVTPQKPRLAACAANVGRATLPHSGGKWRRALPAGRGARMRETTTRERGRRGVAVQEFIITHPARTSIKVLIELFQKFAESRGRASGRPSQRAKHPSVLFREEKGLGKAPLYKRGSLSHSEWHPRSGYFFEDMQTNMHLTFAFTFILTYNRTRKQKVKSEW